MGRGLYLFNVINLFGSGPKTHTGLILLTESFENLFPIVSNLRLYILHAVNLSL